MMSNNYYNDLGIFLYLTPIICMFCFGFALIINRTRTISQIYLAITLFMIGTGMIFSFLYDRYLAEDRNEILRSINFIMSSLAAITVLFYFTSLLQPGKLTPKYISKFLIGATLFSLIIILSEKFLGKLNPITGWDEIQINYTHPTVIYRLIISLVLMIFEAYIFITTIRMYLVHKRFIRETFSYAEGIDLNWVSKSIILFALFGFSDLVWSVNSSMIVKVIFNIISIYIACHIFYLGFRQGKNPTKEEISEDEEIQSDNEPISSIKPSPRQLRIKAALEDLFRKRSPYLNPELSLNDVAEALGTSTSYLSKLIKQEFNTNFYALINGYRIDYAISLIERHKGKITGDTLYPASGFKSRSVFYKQFKERTGYSPLDYINKRWLYKSKIK